MSQSALTEIPDRRLLRRPAHLVALGLGILADWLDLFGHDDPALNFTLWALCATIAAVALVHRRAERPATESLWALAGGLGGAGVFAWRATDAVQGLALLAAIALSGIAAGRAARAWLTTAYPSDVIHAAFRVIVNGMVGLIPWGIGDSATASAASSPWRRVARTTLIGGLMALPVLLVIGTMLRAADPMFNRVMADLIRVDLEAVIRHVAVIGFVTWGVAGYLSALLLRYDIGSPWDLPRPGVRAPEMIVALWLVNALFIAFLLVQLRYLFGGAALVDVTTGLSYAEYARRGFFELVMATALVIPVLLVADWAAEPTTDRQRTTLRGTMLVLLLLLGGVLGSAAYRMHLYQQVYGLTELRLYVSVILCWVAAVLVWLGLTVLRGARERFVVGSVVLGVVCVAGLVIRDPHALIARVNLDRAIAGAPYDGSYLDHLSAEAVPVILDRLPRLTAEERCRLGGILVERWGAPPAHDWRGWNRGEARARRLVGEQRATLACPEPVAPVPVTAAPTS